MWDNGWIIDFYGTPVFPLLVFPWIPFFVSLSRPPISICVQGDVVLCDWGQKFRPCELYVLYLHLVYWSLICKSCNIKPVWNFILKSLSLASWSSILLLTKLEAEVHGWARRLGSIQWGDFVGSEDSQILNLANPTLQFLPSGPFPPAAKNLLDGGNNKIFKI